MCTAPDRQQQRDTDGCPFHLTTWSASRRTATALGLEEVESFAGRDEGHVLASVVGRRVGGRGQERSATSQPRERFVTCRANSSPIIISATWDRHRREEDSDQFARNELRTSEAPPLPLTNSRWTKRYELGVERG